MYLIDHVLERQRSQVGKGGRCGRQIRLDDDRNVGIDFANRLCRLVLQSQIVERSLPLLNRFVDEVIAENRTGSPFEACSDLPPDFQKRLRVLFLVQHCGFARLVDAAGRGVEIEYHFHAQPLAVGKGGFKFVEFAVQPAVVLLKVAPDTNSAPVAPHLPADQIGPPRGEHVEVALAVLPRRHCAAQNRRRSYARRVFRPEILRQFCNRRKEISRRLRFNPQFGEINDAGAVLKSEVQLPIGGIVGHLEGKRLLAPIEAPPDPRQIHPFRRGSPETDHQLHAVESLRRHTDFVGTNTAGNSERLSPVRGNIEGEGHQVLPGPLRLRHGEAHKVETAFPHTGRLRRHTPFFQFGRGELTPEHLPGGKHCPTGCTEEKQKIFHLFTSFLLKPSCSTCCRLVGTAAFT